MCVTQRCCSCRMRLVSLYECYSFAFLCGFATKKHVLLQNKFLGGGLWENLSWSDKRQSPDDNDLAKAQTNKRIHAYITKAINAQSITRKSITLIHVNKLAHNNWKLRRNSYAFRLGTELAVKLSNVTWHVRCTAALHRKNIKDWRPNSTCHVTSCLDTTRHVERVESCRDVTSQVEFGLNERQFLARW